MDLFPKPGDIGELAVKICELARRGRQFGLLSIEEDIPDELPGNLPTHQSWMLFKGLRLIVDGTDPELVRAILTFHWEQMERQLVYRLHVLRQCLLVDFETNERRYSADTIQNCLFPEHPENPAILAQLPELLNDIVNNTIQHAQIKSIAASVHSDVDFEWKTSQYLGLLKREHAVTAQGVLSIQCGDNPHIIAEQLEAMVGYAIPLDFPKYRIAATDEESSALSQTEIDALLDTGEAPRSPFDELFRDMSNPAIKGLFAAIDFETFRDALLLAKRSTVLRVLRALDAENGARLLGGIFRAPRMPRDRVFASQMSVIDAASAFTTEQS